MPRYPSRRSSLPAVQHERARRPVANPPPSIRMNLHPRPYIPTHYHPYPPMNNLLQERMNSRYVETPPYVNYSRLSEMFSPENPNPFLISAGHGFQLPMFPPPLPYPPISQGYSQSTMYYTSTSHGYSGGPFMDLHGNGMMYDPPPTPRNVSPQNSTTDHETETVSDESTPNVEEVNNAVDNDYFDRNRRETLTPMMPNENYFDELGVYLVHAITWTRSMTRFEFVSMSDRITLLRNNWRELVLIIACHRNHVFNEERIVARLEWRRPDVRSELAQIVSLMNRFTRCRVTRHACEFLKKIILFRTGLPQPPFADFREGLQEHSMIQLLNLNGEDLKWFGRLFFLLPSICGLAHAGLVDHLVFKYPCDIDAVLAAWLINGA